MFTLQKSELPLFFTFILLLTGCGLPAGTNAISNFSAINTPTLPLSLLATDSRNPQVAADGANNVLVVWQDGNNINFVSSSNGGSSFTAPIPVPGSAGGAYPRLTTDGSGNAYVIWQSATQFLLNYSTTNGFQSSIAISSICPGQSSQNLVPQADITYAGTNLFIAWAKQASPCSTNSPYNILFTSLPVGSLGSIPTPVDILSDTVFAGYPKIAQFGGDPYIVFLKTSISDLMLSEYSLTSQTQTSFPVKTQNSNAQIPLSSSIGVDGGGNSFVAWEAYNPNLKGVDIYFNTLKKGNTLFNSNPINLSNNGASKGSVVGIDSSQYINVAFFSRPSANPNAYDVFLEQSRDGGKSFIGPMNISNTHGDSSSYAPGMAIVGKTAYVVWDDNSNSTNHQIYFQKITLY
jgi:hypothetical protein